MTTRFSQRQILILISAALVLATLVAYEPIRHNGFVNFDDYEYVTENPNVTGGITLNSVIWAFTKTYAANWHPITWLSHMLDCEIYGLNPSGHHITSVLIHIANTLLLFLLLSRMTGAIWSGAFVAAVFALHPLHVESVAWVAERKDVLSTLFWMLAILAYIHYASRPSVKRYMLVLLAFVMGLMAKPMVVTLPFVLILLDYWPLECLNSKFSILSSVFEKIPMFVLSAISAVVTVIAQHSVGAVVALEKVPLNYRIANMFVSYIKYIGKTIAPSRLAVMYQYSPVNLSDDTVLICMLLFFLITALAIYAWRRRKYIVVGWLWYVGTLVPVIGLVQVGKQSMANRYMYIPMLGLLIIVAWGVRDLVVNRPRLRIVVAVLAVALLSSAAIFTRVQVGYWQNNFTLYEYALKVTENNTLVEGNYGVVLFDAGRIDEAKQHLNNAIRINPTNSKARIALSRILLQQEKPDEAIDCLNKALPYYKDSAKLHYNLGIALSMKGKYDDAIQQFTEVLKLESDYTGAQEVMGISLLAAGRPKDAVEHLNEALRTSKKLLEPVKVYENFGMAYMQLGKNEPAKQNLAKAVELEPNNINALNNLAWLLVTSNDVLVQDANRAVEFARRACELTWYKKPEFLDTLAVAYAAAGRFEDAVNTANQAIDIAKAGNQEDLANEIQSRMKLYQAGQPYREK